MIKERPILFNGNMVRAILEGRKTQTRRVVKLPRQRGEWEATTAGGHGCFRFGKRGEKIPVPEITAIWNTTTGHAISAPYQLGNRLWVRENYRTDKQVDHIKPSELSRGEPILYAADDTVRVSGCHPIEWGRERPSIFLPRWGSRITLEIKAVRAERLQDISRGDAMAEGCPFPNMQKGPNPKDWFTDLWTSINGAESWNANPLVWVIEFEKIAPGPQTLKRRWIGADNLGRLER